jgi:predicted glycosyltransferase
LIVLPRHQEQKYYLSKYFDRQKIEYFFPEVNYFGPDLIWQSDIVIGGGGTMLREACILNIPSYSFFSGRIGHVDSYYVNTKKMSFIRNYNDAEKIKLEKCYNKQLFRNQKVFDFVISNILSKLRII